MDAKTKSGEKIQKRKPASKRWILYVKNTCFIRFGPDSRHRPFSGFKIQHFKPWPAKPWPGKPWLEALATQDFEAKILHLEAKTLHFEAKIQHSEAKIQHFEAKIPHFEAKIQDFEATIPHFEAWMLKRSLVKKFQKWKPASKRWILYVKNTCFIRFGPDSGQRPFSGFKIQYFKPWPAKPWPGKPWLEALASHLNLASRGPIKPTAFNLSNNLRWRTKAQALKV